jgi:hypothetical protein
MPALVSMLSPVRSALADVTPALAEGRGMVRARKPPRERGAPTGRQLLQTAAATEMPINRPPAPTQSSSNSPAQLLVYWNPLHHRRF